MRSTKDAAFWRKQIGLAVTKRQRYELWWEECLKAYAPSIAGQPKTYGNDIHTNRTFTLVERKKADLFYQKPDVTLQPSPLSDGPILDQNGAPLLGPANPQTPDQPGAPIPASAALSAHEEIVNEKLGDDGIDATEMMDAVLFDIVCTQGVGFTKMGYESYTVDTPTGKTHPETGETLTVPVPVSEHCYWHHFSGKQAIIPHDFRSTEWDRAAFLGMVFTLPLTPGNRKKYNLPDDFQGSGSKTDGRQFYDHGDGNQTGENVFTGVELEYRSVLFREDVSHPDHLTQLILVDGLEGDIALERDSPHQTLLPNGTLSADSVIGFTFHPFSTRKLTDSAYVPSDGTMIRPLENELDIFRTQMVQFRDAQILRFIANGDVLPADALAKIVRSPIGGITVVPGEAFVGDGAIKPLEGGSMPRESFQSNDYIDADMSRTTGVDASGAGVQGDGTQTATAAQIQGANANARMDKERSVVLKRYIKGVTKFSSLLQRYLPVRDAAALLGPQRAQIWDAWRKTADSALAFTALPDSALRVDQAVDRKSSQDLYSFLANDPYIQKGRAKLLEKLLRKHHIDPAGIVNPPDPGKPEPPKLSLSFSGDDLVGPQAPIVIEILQQQGITISPGAVTSSQALLQQSLLLAAQAGSDAGTGAPPNTAHGGKLAQQESLSKHHADNTGGMQGSGAPAAMGAAGGHLQ